MEKNELCGICDKEKAFALCPGCGISLCEHCSCLELIGSGCGSVWPVYYCMTCVQNPMLNPNAIFKDPVP